MTSVDDQGDANSQKPPPPERLDQANVAILLDEYRTLRQEILDRIRNGFTIQAGAGAVIAFILTSGPSSGLGRITLALGAFFVTGAMMAWSYLLINNASAHIQGIERRINASTVPELLTWESETSKRRYWAINPVPTQRQLMFLRWTGGLTVLAVVALLCGVILSQRNSTTSDNSPAREQESQGR